MSDETTNPIPDEVVEDAEVEQEESSNDESTDDESDDGSALDDSEEVEHEGKKYKIPKELKSALMMQSDYTRKTQEVAAERRQIEEHAKRVEQEAQAHREDIQDYARLVVSQDRLKQFEQVNWDELYEENPALASKLSFEFNREKELCNNLSSKLNQLEQKRAFEKQQSTAKRLEEGRAILAREIKDWSPQLANELMQFARADGWSDEEISNITPAQVKSLHRSYMGERLLKKQAPKPPVVVAKPVTKVGGNATVRKSPAVMTDAEYAKWRKSGRK